MHREIVWKLLVLTSFGPMVLAVREVLLRLEELLFLAAPEISVVSVEDDGEVIRVGVRCRTAGLGAQAAEAGPGGARLLPAISR
ncbi:hypothetical protein [Kitasatospora sp. NPDC007106]|uniref:hypothetical protein n=1 Tax=Kitasatospora sp. NPDC007106 TaxID=3156914 RepID=UPI003408C71B